MTARNNAWFWCENGDISPECYAGDWCPNDDAWDAIRDETIGWQSGFDENAAVKERLANTEMPFRIKIDGVRIESEPAYDQFGEYDECYLDWDSVDIIEFEEANDHWTDGRAENGLGD